MRDADEIRQELVDSILEGTSRYQLTDVLEYVGFDMNAELKRFLSISDDRPRAERHLDFEDAITKAVEKYVRDELDDEVRAELDAQEAEREAHVRRMFA